MELDFGNLKIMAEKEYEDAVIRQEEYYMVVMIDQILLHTTM